MRCCSRGGSVNIDLPFLHGAFAVLTLEAVDVYSMFFFDLLTLLAVFVAPLVGVASVSACHVTMPALIS